MAKSRYKFFENIQGQLSKTEKGMIDNSILELIRNYEYFPYVITLAEQYRPDLLAKQFYGNGNYHWIITYANNFNNSPEDYSVNKIIKIPEPDIIGDII